MSVLLSVNEAAREAAIGRVTIYKLMSLGRLRSVKIGARRLIQRDSLERLMRSGCAIPASEPDAQGLGAKPRPVAVPKPPRRPSAAPVKPKPQAFPGRGRKATRKVD